MKKILKIILIIVSILIVIILLDSLQAVLFNHNPIIGIETKCMKKAGILVNTYHCDNGENKTKIRIFNHSCNHESVCGKTETIIEIDNDAIKQEFNNSHNKLVIQENFNKIFEISDLTSSNPYDYTKNEYYNNIVNIGSAAVPILKNMYYNGELSGLNAYISALIIQDITKCDLLAEYKLNWSTANEFYRLWENNNCGFSQ